MGREQDFDQVLAAAARLQRIVPDAVLVGGSAAAKHAGHLSFDDDHTLGDLRQRFAEVLEALESTEDWVTARIRPNVLILGRLDGIETGIRQLMRRRPLEVEAVTVKRRKLTVPTLPETLRIKAWLALTRNATRDYLDIVALAERLGADAPRVILTMDEYYADQIGPGGARVATQVVKQLAEPNPYDLSDVDLRHYRKLDRRWRDWSNVAAASRQLAADVLGLVAGS